MATGIADDDAWGIEAARLRVEAGGVEGDWVMRLEPDGLVGQPRERHRVRARESIAGERGDLAEHLVRDWCGDTLLRRPV